MSHKDRLRAQREARRERLYQRQLHYRRYLLGYDWRTDVTGP